MKNPNDTSELDLEPLEHMTLEDFRSNTAHVVALRAFLESPAGKALRSVLAGLDPANVLSTPRFATPDLLMAHASASAHASDSLLGRIQGFGLARETIKRLARPFPENKRSTRMTPKPV